MGLVRWWILEEDKTYLFSGPASFLIAFKFNLKPTDKCNSLPTQEVTLYSKQRSLQRTTTDHNANINGLWDSYMTPGSKALPPSQNMGLGW